MTAEQLEKAKQLQDQIDSTEKTLKVWEAATGFNNRAVYLLPNYDWAPVSPESFTVLKALNLLHFQQILADLKKQFSNI